jgi:phosphonate transport system substrate-binding protein
MRSVLAAILSLGIATIACGAELTIGLIPTQNVFKQMERYKPLGEYLPQRTGVDVRFTILSRYGNIIERFTQESLGGAFRGRFPGALAIEKLGVEPIARPVWRDGTSTYWGYIFVEKDSGIRGVEDM